MLVSIYALRESDLLFHIGIRSDLRRNSEEPVAGHLKIGLI